MSPVRFGSGVAALAGGDAMIPTAIMVPNIAGPRRMIAQGYQRSPIDMLFKIRGEPAASILAGVKFH
jgi:hypothetical protein